MWHISRHWRSTSRGVLRCATSVCRERAHDDRRQETECAAGEPLAALNADAECARGEPVWAEACAPSASGAPERAVDGAVTQPPSGEDWASRHSVSSSSATMPSSSQGTTTARTRRRHSHRHHYTQPGLAHLHVVPSITAAAGPTSGTIVGRVIAQVSDRVLAVQFNTPTAPASPRTGVGRCATSDPTACLNSIQVGERASVMYELNEPLAGGSANSGGGAPAGPSPPAAAKETSTGVLVDGLIVRLNVDGTVVMLLDTGFLDLAVPRESLTFLHRRRHAHTQNGVSVLGSADQPASCGAFMSSSAFADVLAWLASVGSLTPEQQLSTACILYHRGWRADRLYLLERPDVDFLVHLPKPLRLSVLEKAEWERDHHRQLRVIYRERVKEKDRRYLFSKYAGILSASVAFVGAGSLFGWNYKNYLKQQRSYQMAFAVEALQRSPAAAKHKRTTETMEGTETTWRARLGAWFSPTAFADQHADGDPDASPSTAGTASDGKTRMVPREKEAQRLRQLVRRLDCEHPRVPVLTGYYGCGKSSLCRHAMEKEGRAVVFVDVRSKEDMLRGTIKALGVPNADACGDPLDFIYEACHRATAAMRHKLLRRRRATSTHTTSSADKSTHAATEPSNPAEDSMSVIAGLTRAELNATMPIIVLKLREGDNLRRVYEEAVALACDRRVCHFLMEVPLESLTASNTALPGLDFYMIPNFSREEAFAYTQHRLDPLDLNVFMDTVGTNSNDLDELFAAVHQRQVPATTYTNEKLLKAIRQLNEACAAEPQLSRVVKRLAEVPYDVGMEGRREDSPALHHPSLRDIVLYNPVKDLWLFNNEVLHTAAQCCL